MQIKTFKRHKRHSNRCDAGHALETLSDGGVLFISGFNFRGQNPERVMTMSLPGDIVAEFTVENARQLRDRLNHLLADVDADELTRHRVSPLDNWPRK